MNTLQPFSRTTILCLAATLLQPLAVTPAIAEDTKSPTAVTESASLSPEQEAKLTAALADATLKGRWAPIKDGQLGPEKEDAYQIVSAKKTEGDKWVVNARLKYGGQTMDVPVPAVVKWAGDTAVLLFDNVNFGGPRSYTARLMISGNTYSGSWSGGDHGGMLYGVIVHESH
jgi:hypothetical protein